MLSVNFEGQGLFLIDMQKEVMSYGIIPKLTAEQSYLITLERMFPKEPFVQ